jgi:putative oxidoreductase
MIVKAGLPAGLAIPAGIFELVAGLAIALGFMTRFFSILLAGFCILTAVLFHQNVTDPMQAAMALKNLAIAGGFLCLFAHSHMRWSYDSMRLTRRAEIAERDGASKVHEAELRTAAAEARAEGLRTAPVIAAPVVTAPRHDRDRDGIDDRAEPIDPRLRP